MLERETRDVDEATPPVKALLRRFSGCVPAAGIASATYKFCVRVLGSREFGLGVVRADMLTYEGVG
jgi:hypothetical protein